MIYIYLETIESHIFSGGEIHVKNLQNHIENSYEDVMIVAKLRNSEDIMKLFLTTNAIKKLADVDIHLTMEYVPYARQDRVCVKGEAFSLEVFANLINSQDYKSVSILDTHSEITSKLINNCSIYTSFSKIKTIIKSLPSQEHKSIALIAPDKGAYPRILNMYRSFSMHCEQVIDFEIIVADKIRDPKNGKITRMNLDCKQSNSDIAIVIDDICDGGRTFEEVAKLLKPLNFKQTYLYVAHGIFSKGTDTLNNYYDKIYTTNSFYDQSLSNIKVI